MPVVDLKPPAADPELRALAANLRRLRERKQLSRKELARILGASDRQIEHWENAESVPALPYLLRIAREFRRPIESLLHDETKPLALEDMVRQIGMYMDLLIRFTGARVILHPGSEQDSTVGPSISIRAVLDVPPDDPPRYAEIELTGFLGKRPDQESLGTNVGTISPSEEAPDDPEGAETLQESISENR